MIELPLPDLLEQELTLESAESSRSGQDPAGRERDLDGPALAPLAGRITLGGPYAVPVTPDYVADDPNLRAFVEQEAAHTVYHVIHLSVSFASRPAAPRLDTAAVELALSSTSTAEEPVAWSMTPLRVTDSVQMERSFTLGPQLKLQDVEVSLGEIGRTVSGKRTEVFLQALRELEATPAWEFSRTRDMNLYGSYRLIMVVRTPWDGATSISGTVRASTKGRLLRRYRQELPDPLQLATVL